MADAQSEDPAGQEAELDGLRIRTITRMRRSITRGRAYYLLAALGLLAGGAQFGLMAGRQIWVYGWDWWLVPQTAGAVACGLLAVQCWLQARRLARQAVAPSPTPAASPPDFSTLSDGRQHAENLKRIT